MSEYQDDINIIDPFDILKNTYLKSMYYNNIDNYNDRITYNDYERDAFDALTDGQYGNYNDWRDNGGDFDSLMDGLGY